MHTRVVSIPVSDVRALFTIFQMFTLRRTAIAKLSSAISSHSLRLPTSCLPLNRSTMPSSKSSTYQHQGSLPNVPVPELEATATKYFQSTQEPNSPTASDNTSTPAYKHTKACVEDFLRSPLVKELQIITLLIRSIIIVGPVPKEPLGWCEP